MKKIISILLPLMMLMAADAEAQVDKRDVRRGNRDYKKGNYKEAEIEYRKGIVKDSLSVAANYNLAADLYRQNNHQEAGKVLDRVKDVASVSENAADYYYNLDVAIANQDWQTAVSAFEESLLRNPGDLDAKENYIYAKKKLEQQQQQQQQNQDQQNDQNNQDNQDQQQNQNKDDQDQNQDQNQNDDKQDRQNDQNKEQQQNQQGQQPKITPQAAQQMLQAIQAKEKETQEKVKKEKAQALKSRQKERNW